MKNVILITIDTLRKDMLGCYNNSKDKLTPFIDSVAKQSILFTNAQSVGPYTQASFPGILTSSYYLDFDDHGKGKVLSSQRRLISEHLKKNGVITAGFHSNPYLSAVFGWDRGWDIFYDSMEAKVTDEVPYIKGNEINQHVKQWLHATVSQRKNTPFFLWIHYMDIHEPYVPSSQFLSKVDSSIRLSSSEMFELFQKVILPRDVSNSSIVNLLEKLYMAKVIEVDEYIKVLFSIFEEENVLKNSTIIITSDHGDEFGEHGGLSHDGKMFRELIDIPLIIKIPESDQKATAYPQLVSNIDIAPTIVYLFGIPQPVEFQGQPLLPLENCRDRICFGEAISKKGRQKETDRPIFYCRTGELKMIYEVESDKWSLYDLKTDPHEIKNLFGSVPETFEIKKQLEMRIKRVIK